MNRFVSAGLLVTVLFTSMNPCAWALPQGYSSEDNSVVFDADSEANTLIVSSSNENAVVNFDSFTIAAHETVRFQGVNFLGRVTGPSSSDVFGSLFGPTGQLILVNPNGITFHEMANVQVGSLIASTLDIQSSLYSQNQFVFEKIEGSVRGAILNKADIAAADGGHIALLAESVVNQGTLTANQGSVVLGVGQKQTISFDQNNLINLVVDRGINLPEGSDIPLQNMGSLIANGGKVVLSVKTLNDVMDALINMEGVIEATSAVQRDGYVEFTANGRVNTNAQIKTTHLTISEGTKVYAAQSQIEVQGDWSNRGEFHGEQSSVTFSGDKNQHTVTGDNEFNNLEAEGADRKILFEAGRTQTVKGDVKLTGAFAHLLKIHSTVEGQAYLMDIQGGSSLDFVDVRDSYQLGGDQILILRSHSDGNILGWIADPTWTNGNGTNIWSDGLNWDSGVAPGMANNVTFDGTSNASSTIDALFGGTIGSLNVEDTYTGTITMARTLTVTNAGGDTGNVTINGGAGMTWNSSTFNFTITGNFTLGGTGSPVFNAPGDNSAATAAVETLLIGGGFAPASGTFNHRNGIVEFNVAGTASYVSGSVDPTFWDLKCIANGETLSIGQNMTITVASPNTFTLADMTLQVSGLAGSQYSFSGLSNSNTNWSNVTVSGMINTGAYFTPGGAGPVTYGANNSNFGPAIEAVQAAIPQAALQAVQDVSIPVFVSSSLGVGGGGGGSATKRGSGEDGEKTKGSRDAKPISDTTSNVYVAEGIVAFNKNLTQAGSDKSSGSGGRQALKRMPKGESLLYQGDVGVVDAYGRSKIKMRSLFVSSADGLKVIRGSVHTPLKELPMGEKPSDLVSNKKGDTVYASFPAAGNITPVETSEYETEDPILTGKGLSGANSSITLSKDQKKMYVTNTMEDTVKEIDMETQEVTKTFNTGSYPSQVIVADNGNLIISNTLDGTVSVMDSTTGKTINKLDAGNSPYGVALSEETKQLFVADATNSEVLVFDANSFNEKTRIKVGKTPYKLQVAGEFLFVTNRSDDTMSVVSVKDLKELTRIPVGKRPSGLAAIKDTDNTKVYVANELSGNLSLIKVDEKGNAQLAESIATGIGPTSVVISSPEKPVRK